MNWKLVSALSIGGVVMGALAAFVGMRPPVEFTLWILIFLAWLVYFVRARTPQPLAVGLLAGGLAGLWAGIVPTLFLDAYAAHNPWYADQLAATLWENALGMIGFSVVAGVVSGGITGFLAQLVLRRAAAPTAA